jgi:hypothetical protein
VGEGWGGGGWGAEMGGGGGVVGEGREVYDIVGL